MTKKMAVKKNQREKKRLTIGIPKVGKSIFRVMLVLGFVSLFGFSSMKAGQIWKTLWPVEKIVFESTPQFIKKDDILALLAQQEAQGMLGLNLVDFQQSLKSHSWIKGVEVRKVWPNALYIRIEEHIPVAIFNEKILTAMGTEISVSNMKNLVEQLPLVTIEPSEKNKALALTEVWQEFRQLKVQLELLNLNLDSMVIDSVNNWHLKLNNEMTLNLGRKNRQARVARLVNVYSAIEKPEMIKSIDLRYHNGIAVEWLEKTTVKG